MKRVLCLALASLLLLCACAPGADISGADSENTYDTSDQYSDSPASNPDTSSDDSDTVSGEPDTDASDETEASKDEAETSKNEDEISKDEDETSKGENTVTEHPTVSGTFVQLWAFTGYSQAKWESHFDKLLEVGIDTVIIQWTASTPYGKFDDCYYDTALAAGNSTSGYKNYSKCMDNMFAAASAKGVKLFVGLNLSDEWWDVSKLTDDWAASQASVGLAMAQELYDKYYNKYTDSFAGWYWAWELYNHMGGFAEAAGRFLNLYLNGLTEIDPSLPMMLSPFLSSGASTADTERVWKEVFAIADFREGDIFCSQDSIGAGFITMDELDGYFAAMKAAVDTEPGLVFWANNEDFTTDYGTASLDRFVRQMEITDKYVTGHVTFAYSHYYHPDMGKKSYHEQYKHYYETGEIG